MGLIYQTPLSLLAPTHSSTQVTLMPHYYLTMTPTERAKEDMAKARADTTIAVEGLRSFLYGAFGIHLYWRSNAGNTLIIYDIGGQTRWVTRARLLKVVSDDPIFDKSTRYVVSGLRCIHYAESCPTGHS